MKRILSGIQPSGTPHIGNYIGALQRWAKESSENENFFFIPNLHALTTRQDPKELRSNTLDTVAWLLACGIDLDNSIIFAQSQVPAHAELAWVFNNYVTMGELSRMTQYKDKVAKRTAEGQVVGLFTYPALMAADIVLYDADEVPVGEDQKQHVEITRDIATRFNNLYGGTFKVPEPVLGGVGARIMSLQDPEAKMSKSDADQSGNILLSDTSDAIRTKVKRAVTDSGDEINYSKPAFRNLIDIYAAMTGKATKEIESEYKGKGYGEFKADLAEAIVSHLEPIQKRHRELREDENKLFEVLEAGRAKAAGIAEPKLVQVKKALGLL